MKLSFRICRAEQLWSSRWPCCTRRTANDSTRTRNSGSAIWLRRFRGDISFPNDFTPLVLVHQRFPKRSSNAETTSLFPQLFRKWVNLFSVENKRAACIRLAFRLETFVRIAKKPGVFACVNYKWTLKREWVHYHSLTLLLSLLLSRLKQKWMKISKIWRKMLISSIFSIRNCWENRRRPRFSTELRKDRSKNCRDSFSTHWMEALLLRDLKRWNFWMRRRI